MKQKLLVKAIMRVDDKILFLRRASGNPKYIGQFELPGGKIEFGEDPEAALRREVEEEIGVEVGAIRLVRAVSWLDDVERDTQHIVLAYLVGPARTKDGFTLSNEHDKFEWKKLSQLQLNELNILSKIVVQEEKINLSKEEESQVGVDNVEFYTSKNAGHAMIVYIDGGSRGNPGPSASGFVVLSKDKETLFEGGKYLGITTSNQAEYQAVKMGLGKALELGARVVEVRLDSQLVANQLAGAYQIKNRDLWPVHASIQELVSKFELVTFTRVPRDLNQADAMVNNILDQQTAA